MDSKIIGSRIKYLMVIKKIKRCNLAKEIGISYNTLSKKLNGQREFTLSEILKIKSILNINSDLAANIFLNSDFDILENKKNA